MSSDADMDELDGFDPTTPAAKLAAKSKRTAGPKLSAFNTSLNGAGPSKAKPTTIKRPRIQHPPPPPRSDEVEVIDTDGPEEIEAPVAPVKTKAKAKGKAKAETKPVETVDIVDSADERDAAARRARAQKGKATSPQDAVSESRFSALERENQRIRVQLEQSQTREDDLHEAYSQLLESKEKEEAGVQIQVAQLKSLMAAKDEKYQALEAEFKRSKKAALVPDGDPHFVHILTPEAAEKDRLQLQAKLDEAIAASEAKDARIKELEGEVRSLTQERDGEIQRANKLQKDLKAYSSGQRLNEPTIVVRGESERGPLHSAAMRMYEELTNLLITRVKETPGRLRPETKTWTFDCVYTPKSMSAPYDSLMTLNFTLEQGWMYDDVKNPQSPIILKNAYLIQDTAGLDRDDPRLYYLGDSMSFSHEQTHVFGKELMFDFLYRLEPPEADVSMDEQDVSPAE